MIQAPPDDKLFEGDSSFQIAGRYLTVFVAIFVGVFITAVSAFAQTYGQYQNRSSKQNTFRQEIARLDITVERGGATPLPIKMVPRTRRGDIIRVRMLDQPINGIMPDQSQWDWTFVVAFVNPSRNETNAESVSRELNFRRDGWYMEHAFKVPYDSQPIFFLYPRQNYRNKIRKLIRRNFNDLRKIGEKTLEISGAYAQIGTFLNQLQDVIRQNPYVYGNNNSYNSNGSYPSYGSYGGYYGGGYGVQDNFMREQFVERLAQSFNIALPNCWKNRSNNNNYGSNYNQYNSNYGSNDFLSRAQCVAQNVKLEDFDLSVSKILTQGGLLAATNLAKKYPELAHWINIAAVAADLILRITRKTPLKILPTMTFSGNGFQRNSYGNNNNQNLYNQYKQNNYGVNGARQNPYLTNGNANSRYGQPNRSGVIPSQPISIVADTPPTDSSFVSAFPIVLHKWQAQPDPEVIKLPVPRLLERCLHIGRNILKSTDLSYDWLRDSFARDFRLVMSSENGFTKEVPLIKNLGMSGWDLQLNEQDIAAFPKVKMTLTGQIIATRGFNKIRSEKFEIPIPGGGNWEIKEESKSRFSVGGKRRVAIANKNGNCLCLRTVVYKPDFGGEFVFATNAEANPVNIGEDGTYAWFDINTSEFKAGKGNLEVYAFGSLKPQVIPVKLYGPPPEITKLAVHRGDRYVSVEGKRIGDIKALRINGKLAPLDQDLKLLNRERSNRVFVFRDSNDIILSKEVTIEIDLDGGRYFKYPKSFRVLPARPTISANEKGEIKADVVGSAAAKRRGQFDLSSYPVATIDTEKMTVAVGTSLTDYDFRAENLSIETRIENGKVGEKELPSTSFEVIDAINLRISFSFDPQYQQFLAGRRLQFRILDRERGVSTWYTVKQTFVRIPQITAVRCGKRECRISGKGLDYVGQYSVDGGNTWNPPLKAQAAPDGKFFLIVPEIRNKSLLRIKLRDYSNTDGLRVTR